MIQTEKENIVMGQANDMSAFAVLCNESETAILDAKIDAEIAARMALRFFKTIGTITADPGGNDALTFTVNGGLQILANHQMKTITFDASTLQNSITALQNAINALRFFKTVCNITADAGGNDALNMTGAGGIQVTSNSATKTITIDGSSIQGMINALRYFKTVKGVTADPGGNDALDVEGAGGISVTGDQATKKVTIDGTALQDEIIKLQSWDNEDVNKARVQDWMETVAAGTPLYGKYLTSLDESNIVRWWNAMLALQPVRNRGVWVAYSDEYMCYIRPKTRVNMQGSNTDVALIYLPHLNTCQVAIETYNSATTVSAVYIMSLTDMEVNWSELMKEMYDIEAALVAEISARTTAVNTEVTARQNGDTAEAAARTAAINSLLIFKDIGGVAATKNNDSLTITGSQGVVIQSNQAGKSIRINCDGLKDMIVSVANRCTALEAAYTALEARVAALEGN